MPWLVSMRMIGQVIGAPPTTATRRSVIFRSDGFEFVLMFCPSASTGSGAAVCVVLASDPAPSAAIVLFRNERLPSTGGFIARPSVMVLSGKCRLHHRPRIADVECVARVTAAAWILRTEVRAFAVIVDAARVLWVNQAGVFLPDQLLHHGKHVVLAFVDENFRIAFIGLLHFHVSEMHVIDSVARAKPAAHFHGIPCHLAR